MKEERYDVTMEKIKKINKENKKQEIFLKNILLYLSMRIGITRHLFF